MRHCGEEVSAVVLQVQTVRGGAGKCTRCGRPLRDPVSVQRGMGPVCAAREAAWQVMQADGKESIVSITVDGQPLRHIIKHSPTGMEWGYGGSGPSDLALSILTDYLGDQSLAEQVYQEFKRDVVAQLDRNHWRITGPYIAAWLARHGIEAPVRRVVYEGRRAA